jgi:hypothetical protein
VPHFSVFHPYAHITLEVLNALFYFAGFIALGVFISGLLFCRGAVCSSAQASVAFGAFEWILWTATAVLAGMETFKGGKFPLSVSFKRNGKASASNEKQAAKQQAEP